MKEQNYSNHTRLVPMFHFFALPLSGIMAVYSVLMLYKHYTLHWGLTMPALLVLSSFLFTLIGLMARSFALKAQDRAIRAEENLRYFAITGKLLDSKLRIPQIVALRFASNNEFVDLAHLAVEKDMSSKEIKMAIKNWRADYHRV